MTQPQNREEMFRASKLMRGGSGVDVFAPGSRLRIARPLDAESLIGRHEGSRKPLSFGAGLSGQLQKRIGSSRALAKAFGRKRRKQSAFKYDPRQRAMVKVHYYGHAATGVGKFHKHVRYLARDDAAKAPDKVRDAPGDEDRTDEPDEKQARPVERPEHWVFYDATRESVSGARAAWEWGHADRRHFRIILSAENGGRIGDLRTYTRDVMQRAEAELGQRLQWFAVDHHDTDNPHTHIVLRGRREDGENLVLPREFIQHTFRNLARDAATDRLGPRSRDDERQALQREALNHAPTRLDKLIANQLDENNQVRIAELRAPNGSPDMTDAMKTRAKELKNLGLATEVRRNVLQFQPAWQDALKAMELHLDIRKGLMQQRQVNARAPEVPDQKRAKGPGLPFGIGL